MDRFDDFVYDFNRLNMEKKMKFKTEDIISSASGVLVGDIDGVYKVFSFMTGDNLFTHQLPEAMRMVAPAMYKQHPWLNELDTESITPENVHDWIAEAIEKHGEEHELTAAPELWGKHDPIKDLSDVMNDDQEMVVVEV